jgi:hypothetical protein
MLSSRLDPSNFVNLGLVPSSYLNLGLDLSNVIYLGLDPSLDSFETCRPAYGVSTLDPLKEYTKEPHNKIGQ